MSVPPESPPPSQGPYGPPPGHGPYGPPPSQGPYGQPTGQVQPYGPGPGYGQGADAGPAYGVRPDPGPPTDIVSVLGLVFALLLAPVGLVLSIIGIARTRDGRRKGRGLAIAGIVVSVVLSLVAAALIVAVIAFGAWVTTEFESTVEDIEQQNPELFEELEEGGVPSPGPTTLDELLEDILPSTTEGVQSSSDVTGDSTAVRAEQ